MNTESISFEKDGLRILVTDRVISRCLDTLSRQRSDGHDWTIGDSYSDAEIIDILPDMDVFVCSKMSTAMARAGSKLKLVHVPGAGFDSVAVEALRRGVIVANTFHHGPSIAEHVVMVSLMLSRRVLECDREMRAGLWRGAGTDSEVPFGRNLNGRTIGLVGIGEIGVQVAKLSAAFGMRVQAVRHDRSAKVPEGVQLDWVGGVDELPRLMSTSDIIVVSVPLNDSTKGLIDADAIALMSPTAFLINVARGAIVDERALYEALLSKSIGGAGLDVWWTSPYGEGRPPGANFPFADFDNVIMTPHNSGSTRETFEGRAQDIADNIANLQANLPLFNVIHGPLTGLRT